MQLCMLAIAGIVGPQLTLAVDTFVHPSGSDSNAGTDPVAPVRTLQRCVDTITKAGDRCLLKSGVYPVQVPVKVSGVSGTPTNRVAIAAAGDGPVVIDGTVRVQSLAAEDSTSTGLSWQAAPEVGPHVFAMKLQSDAQVTQLFIGHASADETLQMLVPARWPNARFDDKTMYEGPEHWAHAGPAYGGGQHNVSTGVGLVYDAGACRSNETCCSYCNNNSLAASGINATGAVAILNLWADGTGVQIVDDHTPGTNFFRYTATWCKDEIERRGKCGDGYRNGNGRYYLEASLGLLDAPTEWFFEKETHMLYLYPPDGRSPDESGLEVRAKASTYAMEVGSGSSYLDLANISFVATTITATSYDPEVQAATTATDATVFLFWGSCQSFAYQPVDVVLMQSHLFMFRYLMEGMRLSITSDLRASILPTPLHRAE